MAWCVPRRVRVCRELPWRARGAPRSRRGQGAPHACLHARALGPERRDRLLCWKPPTQQTQACCVHSALAAPGGVSARRLASREKLTKACRWRGFGFATSSVCVSS